MGSMAGMRCGPCGSRIRIQYAAIPVNDLANAELFYIEKLGFHIIARFDDTCGNLIQLTQRI